MTSPTPTWEETIDKILADYKTYLLHGWTCMKNDCYQVGEDTEHFGITFTQAKDAINAHIRAICEEVIDMVESCEPDCTPVRHAYHQGQWDMAERQSVRLNELLKDKSNE